MLLVRYCFGRFVFGYFVGVQLVPLCCVWLFCWGTVGTTLWCLGRFMFGYFVGVLGSSWYRFVQLVIDLLS